jgi:hypothetical protein
MDGTVRRLAFVLVWLAAAAVPLGNTPTSVGAVTIQQFVALSRPPAAAAIPRITVPGDRAAFVLTPGHAATLTVDATTAKGKPLAHQTVAFVAPESGSSGTLAAGTGVTHDVVTNARGEASLRFTAGHDPGVFLVDATLKGQLSSTTFALSVTTHPHTGATPVAIRQAVRRIELHDKSDGLAPSLYGPVLLPSGARGSE